MTVYTVGHSTRSLEDLVAILRAHGVELLVDVRRFPADWLTVRGLQVVHLLDERRTRPHRLPDFARVDGERLVYDGGQMELLPPLP